MKAKHLTIFIIGTCVLALAYFLFLAPRPAVAPTISGIQVSTSFYPLYFFASAIGGEKVSVHNITPPGAEPHDYTPTPNDIKMIERSGVLVLNGDGLEAWGDAVTTNINPAKTAVVVAGEGLATRTMLEGGQEIVDPHVWLSPPLAKEMTTKILTALVVADPKNGDYYRENAALLNTKLDQLDHDYRTGLADCARKDFVTAHAAFGYLAATYDLTQVPIAGLSPDAEPSPKQLAAIITFIRAKGINVIFFESLVSPKLAQTIAAETRAETLILDPLEGLSENDLRDGKDYLSVMRENLKNLQIALSCKV